MSGETLHARILARLDEMDARAGAATEGPWVYAAAPAEGSDESAADYLTSALTGAGPLFVTWVPATEGAPDGYVLTAVTGDGPHAAPDAEFIAAARTDMPTLVAVLRAVMEMHRPLNGLGSPPCASCLDDDDGESVFVEWPCPTAQAAATALGVE